MSSFQIQLGCTSTVCCAPSVAHQERLSLIRRRSTVPTAAHGRPTQTVGAVVKARLLARRLTTTIRQRVQERIDGRVQVAEPESDGEELGAYAVLAQGNHDVDREVRREAHGKAHHDCHYGSIL